MAEALVKQKHTIILGGGPSGLGTALGIALNGRPSKVTLVEKKERMGGLSGSFVWRKHTIDYGPHRLSPNIRNIRLLADELLGSDCLIKRSQHGVQFGGRLYQFPPRVRDWVGVFGFLKLMGFFLSFVKGKFHWMTHRFASDTFETTVIRKFGKKFYDEIAAPMAEKVWTQPNEIDPSFVNQRFALVHPRAVLSKLIFPKQELNPSAFYYPRFGYQQLWDCMSNYVCREGTEIWNNSYPKKIVVENNRIVSMEIEGPGGTTTIEGPHLFLVSTIPIVNLIEVMEGVDKSLYHQMLGNLRTKSMILVCLELDKPRALPFRTLIFPEKKFIFNRLFEQNEYSRQTVEEGKSVVVADITPFRNSPLMNESDDSIIERVKSDLKKLKYFDSRKISSVCIKKVEFAYVVPDVCTRKNFKELCFQLRKISNLELLGRFATGEYDNSDYAIENGLTLGALLSGRISKLEYMAQIHGRRDRNIVG